MSPLRAPDCCSSNTAASSARSACWPSRGITSGPSASRYSATLAVSAVRGATVYASSAYTSRATSPPLRSRSSAANLARACSSREGGRSVAVTREDRSSATTSGAGDCHNGWATCRQLGPANATTANVQPSSNAITPPHARCPPATSRWRSRCASTALCQALPRRRRQYQRAAISGSASSSHSACGRTRCRAFQSMFMPTALAATRPGRPTAATAPTARHTVRCAVAPPARPMPPVPAAAVRHRCRPARRYCAHGRRGRR